MENLKKRLSNLLTVKSIVTVTLTADLDALASIQRNKDYREDL